MAHQANPLRPSASRATRAKTSGRLAADAAVPRPSSPGPAPRPSYALRFAGPSTPPSGASVAAALAGLAVFAGCAVALHVNHWGHWPRYLSLFVRELDGALWTFALLGLGFGTLAVAHALRRSLPASRSGTAAIHALSLAAAAILLMVPFPSDRHYDGDRPTTLAGAIHDTAAMAAALLLALAMVFGVRAGRRTRAWERVTGGTYAWPWAYGGIMATWVTLEVTTTVAPASLLQRAVMATGVAWTGKLALRLAAHVLPADAAARPTH